MHNLSLIESVTTMLIRGGWVLFPIFLIGWVAWFFIIERWLFLLRQSILMRSAKKSHLKGDTFHSASWGQKLLFAGDRQDVFSRFFFLL